MNLPNYPLDFSRNFSQIGNGTPSSLPVERKKIESEIENKEVKTASLAETRFNESDDEGLLASKQRKVVARSQKGKEEIDDAEETLKQKESKTIENSQEESIDQKEAASDQEMISSPSSSYICKVPEEITDKQLWKYLKDHLSDMPPNSCFCFPGELKVERDLIKKLLKNPPADSLTDLCAHQKVRCLENKEMTLNGFERAYLKQYSKWFEYFFTDSFCQEANTKNPIEWKIKKETLELFLKSLYNPNILDEQQNEESLIELLDQANKLEIKHLKKHLIHRFLDKLASLNKQKNEDLAKVIEWHTFARCRDLTRLQKNCEHFLIKSFLAAKDDQQKQNLIDKLKMIQMTQLDVSAYSHNEKYYVTRDRRTTYLTNIAYLITELSLTELNLGSCPWLNDSDLALLKDFPLKKLSMTTSYNITGKGLIHLKNMPLEELSLITIIHLLDKDFTHFQYLKNLRVLNLSGSEITGTGFIHLKDLPLQQLILNNCTMLSHENITHLKDFKNLQTLHLYIHHTDHESFLAPLKDLSCLRILHLSILRIPHLSILGNINHLTHLKKLSLEELRLDYRNSVIVSRDLENLDGLPLITLSLKSDHGIEDAALTCLKKLPSLETLNIHCAGSTKNCLTDAGIAHLSHLSSLKKLKLKGEKLTGACLIHLQNLSHLEEFSYRFTVPIKNEDLSDLKKKLPSLKIKKL